MNPVTQHSTLSVKTESMHASVTVFPLPLHSPTHSVSSNSSHTSSISSKTGISTGLSSPPPGVPCVSDEELARLSVRQLNQKLQGQDRQVVSYLKQKRRTLKNRGYALNCRVRRIQNQLQLEADNLMLRDQVRYLRQTVQDLQSRLHYYESPSYALQTPSTSVASTELYVTQLPYPMIPLSSVSRLPSTTSTDLTSATVASLTSV